MCVQNTRWYVSVSNVCDARISESALRANTKCACARAACLLLFALYARVIGTNMLTTVLPLDFLALLMNSYVSCINISSTIFFLHVY